MEFTGLDVGDKVSREEYKDDYSLILSRSAVGSVSVGDIVGFTSPDNAPLDVTVIGVVVRVDRTNEAITRVSFVDFAHFSIGAFDDAIEITSNSIGNGWPFVVLHHNE